MCWLCDGAMVVYCHLLKPLQKTIVFSLVIDCLNNQKKENTPYNYSIKQLEA